MKRVYFRSTKNPNFSVLRKASSVKRLFCYSALQRTARLPHSVILHVHTRPILLFTTVLVTHLPLPPSHLTTAHSTPSPSSLPLSPAHLHFPLQNLSDNSSFSFSVQSSISSALEQTASRNYILINTPNI